MNEKRVYKFGNGQAEGNAKMRNLLGGKGANLAEMNLLGVPVPPGFTITTDVCTEFYEIGRDKVVALLKDEVEEAIHFIEKLMNSKFGDVENPLLLSVRSGARASMPGMMDTILNLGLNDEAVEGLARKTNNPHLTVRQPNILAARQKMRIGIIGIQIIYIWSGCAVNYIGF
jgi:pyruvate,orthophosphate dikinase